MRGNYDRQISLVISELERAERTGLRNDIPIKDINTGSYIYEIYAMCNRAGVKFAVVKRTLSGERIGIVNKTEVSSFGLTYDSKSYPNGVEIHLPDSVVTFINKFYKEIRSKM